MNRKLNILVALASAVFSVSGLAEPPSRGKAEHVVLIVWDGMRPDFVTETNAPTLCQLAREGVTFRNHHSVYPSLTNVNSTVLATGVLPSRSGLLGNYEYRPALDPTKTIRTDLPSVVRKGDELSDGHYLEAPTVPELVHAGGGRTVIVGGKTTTLLHDRRARRPPNESGASVTIFSGATLPESALAPIEKLLGQFPDLDHTPGAAGDEWTTRALTEVLWANDVPAYSVLWLSEPDRTEHADGPGSEAALKAIKTSDLHLAAVLRALEKKGVREKTDVLVVSDHGFSTIEHGIDLRSLLKHAGFTVIIDGEAPAKTGEVRVISNGGSVFFYITEHDPEVSGRLVKWLQQSAFAGVIFSRLPNEGTFPLSEMHLDTAAAPDVVMAFRWNEEQSKTGAPGIIYAMNTSSDVATGTHGTLSKFDLHNIFFAAGPDFRRGEMDELPTGNVDVVPTVLHLLGITPPDALDGRILREALLEKHGALDPVQGATSEAVRILAGGVWRQYLRVSKVGDEVYVDEGNGAWQPK